MLREADLKLQIGALLKVADFSLISLEAWSGI
jgi:hypothetical protein